MAGESRKKDTKISTTNKLLVKGFNKPKRTTHRDSHSRTAVTVVAAIMLRNEKSTRGA